ncbi:unnamed protein product [Polarella glacialis]|uniref:Uncharacterized protein n=1 Tax=Polarella glacialis TaxID=89957 RepID=A0A813FXS4_POLGL|nr:unnamed protein product [Polarella glacialis]
MSLLNNWLCEDPVQTLQSFSKELSLKSSTVPTSGLPCMVGSFFPRMQKLLSFLGRYEPGMSEQTKMTVAHSGARTQHLLAQRERGHKSYTMRFGRHRLSQVHRCEVINLVAARHN